MLMVSWSRCMKMLMVEDVDCVCWSLLSELIVVVVANVGMMLMVAVDVALMLMSGAFVSLVYAAGLSPCEIPCNWVHVWGFLWPVKRPILNFDRYVLVCSYSTLYVGGVLLTCVYTHEHTLRHCHVLIQLASNACTKGYPLCKLILFRRPRV